MKQYNTGAQRAHGHEGCDSQENPPNPPFQKGGEGGFQDEGERLSGQYLTGGIIAAGEGSRLKRDGFTLPKPMVLVAGVPLIERVVSSFAKVGITRLRIIFNEDDRECATFVQERFPNLDIHCIVKTTRSSYESFWEVGQGLGPGLTLMSTVDWICPEGAFRRFVDQALRQGSGQARRCRQASVVLAVTPFVADESPLWVTLDPSGRVTAIGGSSGDVVTAGLYLVSDTVFAQAPHPSTPRLKHAGTGLSRLRDFLTWMVDRGVPVYGVMIDQVIDVDRAEDLQLAETLLARSPITPLP